MPSLLSHYSHWNCQSGCRGHRKVQNQTCLSHASYGFGSQTTWGGWRTAVRRVCPWVCLAGGWRACGAAGSSEPRWCRSAAAAEGPAWEWHPAAVSKFKWIIQRTEKNWPYWPQTAESNPSTMPSTGNLKGGRTFTSVQTHLIYFSTFSMSFIRIHLCYVMFLFPSMSQLNKES